MGIFLIILGLLGIVGSGFYLWYRLKAVHGGKQSEVSKNELIILGLGPLLLGLSGICLNVGIALANNWYADGGHMACMIIGGFFFFLSLGTLALSIYFRYFHSWLKKEQRKTATIVFFSSIVLVLVFFLLAGEGMAPYLTYPLVSGFAIGEYGWAWLRPNEGVSGGLKINWYGLIILLAAIAAYKIGEVRVQRKYGKSVKLDSTFLVAFPAGIIGARIWYVVGNWNGDGQGGPNFSELCASGQWYRMFAIWEGGLTILGGAFAGILAGVLWVIFRKKEIDVRYAMDAIIPGILLAQALGRWGNFFNQEVFGNLTNMSDWPLLPTWLKYNMAVSWKDGAPSFDVISKTVEGITYSGNMYVPLFLIEGIFNFAGFLILSYLVPVIWKKGRSMGCIGGLYLIWYGITRMIMEPLRDPKYNMGSNGMWSFWNSMIYIIIGILLVVAMQLYALYRKKKGWPIGRGEPGVESLALQEEGAALSEEEPTKGEEKKKDALSAPRKLKGPDDDKEE